MLRNYTKEQSVCYTPDGREMFRWKDGIYRISPEKPEIALVEASVPLPRSLSSNEKGRYRVTGRTLARLIAGKTSDPRLMDKLIPLHAPKQVVREASFALVQIASETAKSRAAGDGEKPQSEREKMAVFIENFLQAVGVKTLQIRRELAVLEQTYPIDDHSSISSIESSIKSLNEQFPPITHIEGNGSHWVTPNLNKAYQIHKGRLETRRGELRAKPKKK